MAEKPTRQPNVDRAARYLRELEQAPKIAKAVLEQGIDEENNSEFLAHTLKGYHELIDLFNASDSPIDAPLLPNVMILKDLLGGRPLPSVEELSAFDYYSGIRAAKPLMIDGQKIKARIRRGERVAKTEIGNAIGAPSVDTDPLALAVGTTGHILERAIFRHVRRSGIDTSGWVKDQVLWALEDLALLKHADHVTYGREDSALFQYFATPPGASGGMGWRKAEQVQKVIDEYQGLETMRKANLLETYDSITGEPWDTETSDIPSDDLLGDMVSALMDQGLEDQLETLYDTEM